jgi:AraC-like DNA-binding protein
MAKKMSELGWRRLECDLEAGGLHCIRAGHHGRDDHPGGHFRHWGSTHYGLVLLLSGSGILESATLPPTPLKPGDCIVCLPGLWHNYGPAPGASWEEYYVFFDGPVAEALLNSGRLDPARQVVHSGVAPSTRRTWEALLNGVATADAIAASSALFALLAHGIAQRDSGGQHVRDPELLTMAQRLSAEPGKDWNFVRIAADLGQSYETFRKRFRRHFAISPQAWLARERLHRACSLLVDGHRVGWVADVVGFSDAFHFSRTFRARMGCSPRAFARQQRNR